jgi:guanylate kinase
VSRPLIIVLHGPSGVGKDSLIDRLRQRTGIHRATSSTSRAPRDGETDGNHYHFLSKEEFQRKAEAGDFAEWALVYGDYKGLERREIEGPLTRGEDVIVRTDVQGAKTWRKKLDGAIYVMLVPEDLAELRSRLARRGSEDADAFDRRLAEFDAEMADLPNNDYVIRNRKDRLEDAVSELERIIAKEHSKASRPGGRIRP